jgi:phage-related protein
MPATKVVFYLDDDGSVPLLEWLDELPKKARGKCIARLERLAELGHELRRPEADLLRDNIHELRVGLQGINYRMLYFFHGKMVVVVSHGLVKVRVVPPKEIDLAVKRKKRFEHAPEQHVFERDLTDG